MQAEFPTRNSPHESPPARGQNPYRMPKPGKAILFKGIFMPATAGGRYRAGSLFPLFVKLTPAYLWLSRELSVPLSDVTSVELIRNDRALRIDYHNRLEGKVEGVCLCAMDLLGIGLYNTRKVRALHRAIEEAKGRASAGSEALSPEHLKIEATGCESCGDRSAAMVHLYYFSCVGVYPLAGILHWGPRRRLLCRKHATREVMGSIVRNALLGNMGFPGFLVTPFVIAKCLWSLHKTHRAGWQTILVGTLLALAVPAAATVVVLACLGIIPLWP